MSADGGGFVKPVAGSAFKLPYDPALIGNNCGSVSVFGGMSLTLGVFICLLWLWLEGFNPQDHKQNKRKIAHNVKLNP